MKNRQDSEKPEERRARRLLERELNLDLERVTPGEEATVDYRELGQGGAVGVEVKRITNEIYNGLTSAYAKVKHRDSAVLSSRWTVMLDRPTLSTSLAPLPPYPEDDQRLIVDLEAIGTVTRRADRVADWRAKHPGPRRASTQLRGLTVDLEPSLSVLEQHGVTNTRGLSPYGKPRVLAEAIVAVAGRTGGALCARRECFIGERPGIDISLGSTYIRTGRADTVVGRIDLWLGSEWSKNLLESLANERPGTERHAVLVFDAETEPEYQSAVELGTDFCPTQPLDARRGRRSVVHPRPCGRPVHGRRRLDGHADGRCLGLWSGRDRRGRSLMSDHPVVLCFPYLPLAKSVAFDEWWLGPLRAFQGPWASDDFETRVRQFLGGLTMPGGGAVENPALLARVVTGADGHPPSVDEHRALHQAVSFATIDSNRWWEPGAPAWNVATADNADLWVQPLDVADGSITLERGRRVRAVVGGYSVADKDFRIPAPLELHLPGAVPLDEDLLAASYESLLRPPAEHADRAARIAVAMHWVTKGWLNTASFSESDQPVFLKTASEALTGETRRSHVAEARLRQLYCGAVSQEGEGLGIDALLWSPSEPKYTRTWVNRGGVTEHEDVTAIEHWYGALADARNDIVHALGTSPDLVYEQPGSAYKGPLIEVGDRVMREAICVELGACGYPDVWRRGITRGSMAALRRLRADQTTTAPEGR